MPRDPFVWEVHVHREMIDDEILELRELPYALWAEVVGSSRAKTVTGRDNKSYRILVSADWADGGRQNIRVTATLQRSGWRPHTLMRQAFVITPDNQLLEELTD
jgi:hypothetical protein